MIVPMIKGECDGRFINWHFDPRILTSIGLGASGTTVQYGKDYPLIPALLCEQTLTGIIAIDFTTILPESGDKLSTACMIAEITGYLENCNRDGVIAAYNSIFGIGSAAQDANQTGVAELYSIHNSKPSCRKIAVTDFEKDVTAGYIKDNDGVGYYATAGFETTLQVDLSDIKQHFPFVIWYAN